MKRAVCDYAVASCSGIALAFLVARGATAQTCYRVTELTPLGFTPQDSGNTGIEELLAINANGEVVGSIEIDVDPGDGEDFKHHAFLWLPAPAYGLVAGFHDLHEIADGGLGLPVGDESIARDINNAGIVVGQIGNSGHSDENEAIVWQLDYPGIPAKTCRLGFFDVLDPCNGQPDCEWSIAYAINDEPTPLIVGDALLDFQDNNCNQQNTGFRTRFHPALETPCAHDGFEILEQLGSDKGSYARDINTPAVGDVEIVGISSVPTPLLCSLPECEVGEDAIVWPPDVLPMPAKLDPISDGGHKGRGMNNNGQLVGVGFDDDQTPCRGRALFWDDSNPLTPPFTLGSVMPVGQGSDESHAEGINNLGLPQVVGWNETQDRAIIWTRNGITFDVANPNDDIGHCSLEQTVGAGPTWLLFKAHDINDNGWIVGSGHREGRSSAYLLTPLAECPTVTCVADIDGNGAIGITDFLRLLGKWGSCFETFPDDQPCREDLDCDGEVGITDFLLVLATWENEPVCPGSAAPPPLTIQQVVEAAGLTYPDDWDDFRDAIEDPNVSEAEKDNWRCWMDHYLECHPKFFCFECACLICPDVDPYGNHWEP